MEKLSQLFHSYSSRTRGSAKSTSPAIMGSSKNSMPRRELPISAPSSAFLPPVLSRLISGKITLVIDNTRIPEIIVYRVLA